MIPHGTAPITDGVQKGAVQWGTIEFSTGTHTLHLTTDWDYSICNPARPAIRTIGFHKHLNDVIRGSPELTSCP
eukprot:9548161-Heterocapsa_arctica.AAC.1